MRVGSDGGILCKETNKFKRLIEKSLLVSMDKTIMNKQIKSILLELF